MRAPNGGETPMNVLCQAGARGSLSVACLVSFAFLAAEVAIGQGASANETSDSTLHHEKCNTRGIPASSSGVRAPHNRHAESPYP